MTEEKFELTQINGDELRAWALRRGFAANDQGVLVAPYGDIEIHIVVKKNDITVGKVWQGKMNILAKGPILKDVLLYLDQFDMVHGIGLFTRFYSDFRETGERPVWFSDALVKYVDGSRRTVGIAGLQ
jgi:hypothetical protein